MNEPRRYVFIPSDYREPVVLGWLGPCGWVPDEPCGTEGFLVALEQPASSRRRRRRAQRA